MSYNSNVAGLQLTDLASDIANLASKCHRLGADVHGVLARIDSERLDLGLEDNPTLRGTAVTLEEIRRALKRYQSSLFTLSAVTKAFTEHR